MKREMGEEINTYVAIDLHGIFDFDLLKYRDSFQMLAKDPTKREKMEQTEYSNPILDFTLRAQKLEVTY